MGKPDIEPPGPSSWVARWAPAIPDGGRVLDLACGGGRHTRLLAHLGYRVLAVDRDLTALAQAGFPGSVSTMGADLEQGAWPFGSSEFDGIIVTNYLHRPLFPHLIVALRPGGVLICETFAQGNEKLGRPRNPEFLLAPGELLELVRGRLRVIAFEDVFVEDPRPALVQRICAIATS